MARRADIRVDTAQNPPCCQHGDAEQHNEPDAKENNAPVLRGLKMHSSFYKKAVMVTGVAFVEESAELQIK